MRAGVDLAVEILHLTAEIVRQVRDAETPGEDVRRKGEVLFVGGLAVLLRRTGQVEVVLVELAEVERVEVALHKRGGENFPELLFQRGGAGGQAELCRRAQQQAQQAAEGVLHPHYRRAAAPSSQSPSKSSMRPASASFASAGSMGIFASRGRP